MSKTCIGFGTKEGKCTNKVDPKINPYWCPECNNTRIDHIDKQFEKMIKDFPSPKVF